MCGRYTLTSLARLRERFALDDDAEEFATLKARYNIAPTQRVPMIPALGVLCIARWGLLPSWAKDEKIASSLINARAETVATKPAFRAAFKRHRCLIPADGFYEWEKTHAGKIPHRFTLTSGDLFAFAGLRETWHSPKGETVHTCSVITTTANALVAPIHDRMPVILTPEREADWLNPVTTPEVLAGLLVSYDPEQMLDTRVSTQVNKASLDFPELLNPPLAPENSA